MLEIKVLTEDDEVITYNYENRQDLLNDYFISNIDADIPSNDIIAVFVDIDFDTLMYLMALEYGGK